MPKAKHTDVHSVDFEAVKAELEGSEVYEDDAGNKVRSVWLGTIYALTPSGKMYTAWASSNVTPAEFKADEKYFEALEKDAELYGLTVDMGESGEDIRLVDILESA